MCVCVCTLNLIWIFSHRGAYFSLYNEIQKMYLTQEIHQGWGRWRCKGVGPAPLGDYLSKLLWILPVKKIIINFEKCISTKLCYTPARHHSLRLLKFFIFISLGKISCNDTTFYPIGFLPMGECVPCANVHNLQSPCSTTSVIPRFLWPDSNGSHIIKVWVWS